MNMIVSNQSTFFGSKVPVVGVNAMKGRSSCGQQLHHGRGVFAVAQDVGSVKLPTTHVKASEAALKKIAAVNAQGVNSTWMIRILD